MKIKKQCFLLICVMLMSCNKTIVTRTSQELIAEFTNDWENAHKFYERKLIKISGIPISRYHQVVVFGEKIIEDYNFTKENNDVIIECELNIRTGKLNFNLGETITILGEYQRFINLPNIKSIILKNCILVYGDELEVLLCP
jgi:hypothetical protein